MAGILPLMGLRCSILGHEYADPEVRRDREDRGDEVVVTVTEVRVCERCGGETVVSENTEVRSVATPEDAGLDEEDGGGEEEDSEDGSATTARNATDAAVGGAAGSAEETTAEEDDGVILDEESPERDPGEWPEADDTHLDDTETGSAAPDEGDADAEPEPTGDDGAADGDDTDEPAGGGEPTPDPEESEQTEILDDAGPSAEPEPEPEPGPESEPASEGGWSDTDTSGGGAATGRGESAGDDAVGTGITRPSMSASDGDRFVCPECGHEASTESTSLRAGDICPECAAGYLAER